MFSTVKEVHIAIETGLQQVATNRKQVFKPEQFDMILNTEILQYIEDKIDPLSNPKREGFEDNQRRVDELKDIKKSSTLRFYNDIINRKYAIIPSDYYKLIAGGCIVQNHYNKKTLTNISNNEIRYIYTLEFPNDIPTLNRQAYKNITISTSGGFSKLYDKAVYAYNAKFDIINFYLDYFRKELGIQAYWEYYNNAYTSNTFTLVFSTVLSNPITLVFTAGATNTTVTTTSTATTETLVYNTTTGNTISASIELISSKQKAEILSYYYLSKNRHNQSICTEDNNKLNIYYDNTFVPLTIDFNYIIKPKLINYYYNIMPELSINNEIITKVVDKLKVLIKDEQAYNMFNNQVQKVQ